ncbi:MAG: CBS domain-containing protein [Venatoribacter sp.]
MALVVYDMGVRIDSPIRPEPKRVQASAAAAAIHALNNNTQSATAQASAAKAYSAVEERAPDEVAQIKDILRREVITLKPEQTLSDAWLVHQQTGYHHFPVVNDERKVLAMFSDGDLLRALVKQAPHELSEFWKQQVISLANHPVLCVQENTDIRQSSNLLYEHNIGALPVLDNQHRLCGIVTRGDILKLLSHYGPMQLWA